MNVHIIYMYIGNIIVYYKIIIKRPISYNMRSHLHDDSTMGDSINATLLFFKYQERV